MGRAGTGCAIIWKERTPSANLGAPLASLPRVQEKFGEIEGAAPGEPHVDRDGGGAGDAGHGPNAVEANNIKFIATTNAIRAVEIGLELTGNPGLSRRNPLERHYRDEAVTWHASTARRTTPSSSPPAARAFGDLTHGPRHRRVSSRRASTRRDARPCPRAIIISRAGGTGRGGGERCRRAARPTSPWLDQQPGGWRARPHGRDGFAGSIAGRSALISIRAGCLRRPSSPAGAASPRRRSLIMRSPPSIIRRRSGGGARAQPRRMETRPALGRVAGSTVGLIGLGAIGEAVARRAHPRSARG